MSRFWVCVKIGSAACRKIVPVAPWMLGAYMAAHPLPAGCASQRCHWTIPKREFMPGGMFGPKAPARPDDYRPPPAAFSLSMLSLPGGMPTGPDGPTSAPTPTTTPTPPTPAPKRTPSGFIGTARAAPQPVPEPSSASLFGLAALATILAARARRLPVPRAAG